jgi:2-polyprenyl-3-methyl-5-hydroxy-6-metoxy-1,4-benzoquinol methylase
MIDLDDFRFQRGIDLLQASNVTIHPQSIWLDLGCHQGQFLKKLITQHGVRGIGFDDWEPHQKSLADSHWEYFKADLDQELPWPEQADFISALEVLEHMIDTDGFLSRIFDRLKPNGRVLISTPNINCLRNRVTGLFGIYPTGLEFRNIIHHVRLYNVETLRSHLLTHGFQNVRIGGVSFLPLSTSTGTSSVSCWLADTFPQFCNNILATARRP